MKKTIAGVVAGTVMALSLTACGGSSNSADGELNYWLWDANQLPAYKQCAADFTEANPDIKVKVTQRSYGDYWTTLTNGFIGGNAPDVFTNHLSQLPELIKTKQLMPLDDAFKDNPVDYSTYTAGLADLWVGEDGKRYGLPKDWDTVAMFYNKDLTSKAGYTPQDLAQLSWNPEDGGTYEKAIAHLTVDKKGKRGDEAGFDKKNVAVYGLGLQGSGGKNGQTEWSYLTGTTGWTHTDKNPWGTRYNYDDPRFQDTIDWYSSLIEKGYMTKLENTVGASSADVFGAGKTAIDVNGSWMIGQYNSYKDINLGIAPTPTGPNGKRASMLNGLADSIWSGTKQPEAAAKFVRYLGSPDCQDVVASKAVVFPSVKTSADKATQAFKAKGLDITPFTDQVKDKTTFLFPIAGNTQKVDGIMVPAMDAVYSGKKPASSLSKANEQVNALFK